MQIVQFVLGTGERRVGRIDGDRVVDITNSTGGLATSLDLVEWADEHRQDLRAAVDQLGGKGGTSYALSELDVAPGAGRSHLAIPIDAPEVWGCGVTYQKSAEFRDEETSGPRGFYDYVYSAPHPEIFFKATPSRCVGPNAGIGIRSDSSFTAPEPEVAIVIGKSGTIFGYTVADDVSAWDIERENPLYLTQSKIFTACCALGPALVTPDEVGDPYGLTVIGRIIRDGKAIFDDRVETKRIRRRLEELVDYLRRDNPIPSGTVVLTGTGVIASAEHALREGDVVEIEVPGLGTLRNPARRLG